MSRRRIYDIITTQVMDSYISKCDDTEFKLNLSLTFQICEQMAQKFSSAVGPELDRCLKWRRLLSALLQITR